MCGDSSVGGGLCGCDGLGEGIVASGVVAQEDDDLSAFSSAGDLCAEEAMAWAVGSDGRDELVGLDAADAAALAVAPV